MNYYENKIVIVTGGASGLGMALCKELGRRGATVISVDINQEGAQQVAAHISEAGGAAHFAYLDVSLYENAHRIISDIVAKYGRLDMIFNNAGTAIQGETRDLDVRHWRKVIDVNLWGVIYSSILAYNVMEKQKEGQIINISSLAGLIPVPKEIPYCTSKWAIVGFSQSLRVEGADLGIKVNLVCPGLMQTPIHETTLFVNVDKEKLTKPKVIRSYMDPAKAADIILKGVERNKSLIIFPLYARLIWWLYRINASVFQFLFRDVLRSFRKSRLPG